MRLACCEVNSGWAWVRKGTLCNFQRLSYHIITLVESSRKNKLFNDCVVWALLHLVTLRDARNAFLGNEVLSEHVFSFQKICKFRLKHLCGFSFMVGWNSLEMTLSLLRSIHCGAENSQTGNTLRSFIIIYYYRSKA